MDKKIVFFDLDGTLISHASNSVPDSTRLALKKLEENGHLVVIATGRVPALFYGVEKDLGISSFVAANGRIVEHKGEIIYCKAIEKDVVKKLATMAYESKIDIGFESYQDYVLHSRFTELPNLFSDIFHLEYPKIHHNYHLDHDVYQMVMFYNKDDYKKFSVDFPSLNFSYSNQYGLDINEKGGLKEIGVKELLKHLGLKKEHAIAVGDGFNDISMIEYCGLGIAMGNAAQEVKDKADMIADSVDNDGIYKVFEKLKMI